MATTHSQPRTGNSPSPRSSSKVDEFSFDRYVELHQCIADPNKPPPKMKEASEEFYIGCISSPDGEAKKGKGRGKGKRSRKAEKEDEEEDGREEIKNKGKKGIKSRQTEDEEEGEEIEEDGFEDKENTEKRQKNGVIEDSDEY